MTTSDVSEPLEGIAIVGMAGRFPGATNLDDFWANLKNGVESVRFFTDEELKNAGISDHVMSDPSYVKARGALDDIEGFDAGLFGFTPREAEIADPQQRIFLECVWEALENAGYDASRYPGDIGLYAGNGINTYLLNNLLSNRRLIDTMGLLQTATFNRNDHLTTHTAYKLNLKGPSVTVQTACSTSLVAVHMACQALNSYQCDMALAGGVAVAVPNITGYLYHQGGIGSPDGHCRAFDAEANGTVSGSGAGVVVLKRLEDALADGDQIRAVIRGSAINNDGADKVGYTAPSVSGQAQVVAMAQAISGVTPEQVSYVEAHGTGTALGDPIEIAALSQVFRHSTQKKTFCAIGSVKSNIGHLDTAAGIAGLIKTTLALEHRQLPASLHFTQPNPRIDFKQSPFFVNSTLNDWESNGQSRIAGVSSFGIGGTNAHVVIEEAPQCVRESSSPRHHLLVLSAKTKTALNAMAANLADHLRSKPDLDLADVAYTLQVGRRTLGQRCAFVCKDTEDALSALSMSNLGNMASGTQEAGKRPIAFMFPGQGSQHINAAIELYQCEDVFRQEVEQCSRLLLPHLGEPIQDLLFTSSVDTAEAAEKLQKTEFAQPALFVLEYALAKLFMSWGVKAQAMIGHSVGEYVAACLSGVFSLEDGLRLVSERGRLMQTLPGGSMLSVSLSESELLPLIGKRLEIAAVNSPSLCVVAGAHEEVDKLEEQLVERGVGCLRLRTSHAFHSSMMEPILEQFRRVVDSVSLQPPTAPYVSTLTGDWITEDQATSTEYWVRHLREPVQFGQGLSVLLKDPSWILMEVGPGRALMSIARRHPDKAAAQMVLNSLPPPETKNSSIEVALLTLGQLWTAGVEPNWQALHGESVPKRVSLPSYPFERKRYWIEAQQNAEKQAPADATIKEPNLANWFYEPSWKRVSGYTKPQLPFNSEGACWLLFIDQTGVADQLAEWLSTSVKNLIKVAEGKEFVRRGPYEFDVDSSDPKSYERLFQALKQEKLFPNRIVHAWGIATPDEQLPAPPGFYSLLFLAQSLGVNGHEKDVHIDVVSTNIYEVTGTESVSPLHAMLKGPCLVIPQEYAGVTCRLIDLCHEEINHQDNFVLSRGLLENLYKPGIETLAYRGGHLWTQFFDEIETNSTSELPFRLKQNGVYLITGGLGGVGLTIANYLASNVQGVKLILVGRSVIADREVWSEQLQSLDEGTQEHKMIASLLSLEAQGGEVAYYSVDVSDREKLTNVLQQATARFGKINGLIHTAGVPGQNLIQQQSMDKASLVFAAKVRGTRELYYALGDQPLDFSILCSSRSALLGGVGSVDYSAANAYLDAFAHRRRKQTGEFVVSINWPAWQEVGMLLDTANAQRAQYRSNPTVQEPIGHPLVENKLSGPQDIHVFSSRFSVKSHWVLDEHRILGAAVVPGVTYLEIARAAFHQIDKAGPVEIRDVYFLTPLRVQDDEARDIKIVLQKSADGYDFYVESAPLDDTSNWVRHAIGHVCACATPQKPPVDIPDLIRQCNHKAIRLTEENFFDESLGPRWQCANHVHLGENQLIAELCLPSEYRSELEKLQLHPALLDRSAGIGLLFLVEKNSGYLPFSYQRLRLFAPLSQRIYLHSRGGIDQSTNGETTAFDVDIYGEDGTLLAEIQKFSHKRINEVGKAVNALMAGHQRENDALQVITGQSDDIPVEGQDGHDVHDSHFDRALSLGVTSDEGVGVFARILRSEVPAQVIVSPNNLVAAIEWAQSATPERYIENSEKLQLPVSRHARPDIGTDFVEPGSELECRLVALWQECLGIDQIGTHDNFFELGGNSVLAIQIMANAKKLGLNFNVQQLFQYSTIAELAAFMEEAESVESGTRNLVGLLPLQHRFFTTDKEKLKPAAWSMLVEVEPDIDLVRLQKIVPQWLANHGALRQQFFQDKATNLPDVTLTASDFVLEVLDINDISQASRVPSSP